MRPAGAKRRTPEESTNFAKRSGPKGPCCATRRRREHRPGPEARPCRSAWIYLGRRHATWCRPARRGRPEGPCATSLVTGRFRRVGRPSEIHRVHCCMATLNDRAMEWLLGSRVRRGPPPKRTVGTALRVVLLGRLALRAIGLPLYFVMVRGLSSAPEEAPDETWTMLLVDTVPWPIASLTGFVVAIWLALLVQATIILGGFSRIRRAHNIELAFFSLQVIFALGRGCQPSGPLAFTLDPFLVVGPAISWWVATRIKQMDR